MSDEAPVRRALVVWYDDAENAVELDDTAFTPLEVPELLRVALDIAESQLPSPAYADDTEE